MRVFDTDGDHVDINHAKHGDRRALMFTTVDRGAQAAVAVALHESAVRELVAFAQSWLDEPRDAARAAAEVVIDDTSNDVRLLRTSLGEWGVGQVSADFDLMGQPIGDEVAITWRASEREARALFAELRGKVVCDCGAEVDEDEATDSGDGWWCETCANDAREEFKRTRYECIAASSVVLAGVPVGPGCGWVGVGADVVIDGEWMKCPTCGGEVEESDEEPVAEAATP